MVAKIKRTIARQVLDSRGNPTIWTAVVTDSNEKYYSVVPSGASTGSKEALELRDQNKKFFNGKSVSVAISNTNNKISEKLKGQKITDQEEIDQIMIDLDGTKTKSSLGANAMLGVSMAVARAGAKEQNVELFQYIRKKYDPYDDSWNYSTKNLENLSDSKPAENYFLPNPMFNMINGGSHAFNSTDFQEFMVVPITGNFQKSLQCGFDIYNELKKILESKNLPSTVGDEGGFATSKLNNSDPLDLLIEATLNTKWTPGKDVKFALDVAASEFYNKEKKLYELKSENLKLSSEELISIYKSLISKYPIYSIEDGLSEDDWDGWGRMTSQIGDDIQLVGDDLFVTQKEFLNKGIKEKAGNSILIKLNQVGTVSETIDTIIMAQKNNFSTIISHRSGETEDTFIADLAVGTNSNQLKSGAPARGERISKYNRTLLMGENDIGHLKTLEIKKSGIKGYKI